MDRFFLKKSVVLILLFTTISCGFLYARTANALNARQEQAQKTIAELNTRIGNAYKQLKVAGDAKDLKTQAKIKSIIDSLNSSKAGEQKILDGTQETGVTGKAVGGALLETGKSIVGIAKDGANYLAGISSLGAFTAIMTNVMIWKTAISFWLAEAGGIFDISINVSIVNIKSFFDANGPLDGLWTMMRDLFNVCFIFLLLYVAITQIIGAMNVKAKTTLISIIIAAVFINFSMFFVKLIIDLGNIVAIALYNSYSSYSMGLGVVDTSLRFLQNLDLLDLAKNVFSISGQTNMLAEQILQIVLMLTLIYIYLFGAFLLIGRTVMLVFLSIFSPIGFVGSAIPGFGDWSNKWWEAFMNQVFVAPLMMFLLLIVSRLIDNNYLREAITKLPDGFKPPSIDVAMYVYYIVTIAFLIIGMRMVKKLSGAVSTYALGAAKIAAVVTAAVVAAPLIPAIGAAAAGGAATLGGAGASGALGAARSGATAATRLGTRLASTGAKNFITGKFDKSGVGGMVTTFAREKVLSGVKDITGGQVDIDKLLKMKKDSTESAKKNLTTATDKITEGAEKKVKTLQGAENNINAQAAERAGGKEAGENLKKEFEAKEAAFSKMTPPKAGDELTKDGIEYRAAKTDMDAANTKLEEFRTKMKQAQKDVAEELGVDFDKLGGAITAAKNELSAKQMEKNIHIKEKIENGDFFSTLLTEDDRKELAAELRSQKGKFQSDKDKFWKDLKETMENGAGGGGNAGPQAGSPPRNPNTAPIV